MDNTPNINDIISNLTPDDINMLKGVASSILGEGAPENTQSTTQNFNNNQNNNQNQNNLRNQNQNNNHMIIENNFERRNDNVNVNDINDRINNVNLFRDIAANNEFINLIRRIFNYITLIMLEWYVKIQVID